MRKGKVLFIVPERLEFINLVESLSTQLSKNDISMVALFDEHETDVLGKIDKTSVPFKNLSDYDSKTSLGILGEELPDLVVTDNDQEPIRGAFVLAAHRLNIPVLVLREMVMVSKPKFDQMFYLLFRKVGEFPRIFSKYFFCFRSILEIKPAYFLSFPRMLRRFVDHLSNPTAGEFADYILANTEDDAELLRKSCKRFRFVRAVGDPRFDAVVSISPAERLRIRDEVRKSFDIPANKRMVLFLSSSQVEHGMWTSDQKKQVNIEIFNVLNKYSDSTCTVVKLHPVEKNIFPTIWKPQYDGNIHITDSDLSQLICSSDLVITWVSTAMLNVVLAGIPLVVIDFFNDWLTGGVLLSTQAIVDRGAALKAVNVSELDDCVRIIVKNDDLVKALSASQEAFRKDYLKTIDGKSIGRISETITEILADII